MNHSILFTFALLWICNCSQAQVTSSDNIVGKNYIIHSSVLHEEVKIQVQVPENYDTSANKYPVLFLLDGQSNFNYGVNALHTLTTFGYTPEFIVVGIITEGAQRGEWFFDNQNDFVRALKEEIIFFVDSSFRTSGERILFGWEGAGGLALEALTSEPDLFDSYLLASPTPIYGSYFPAYKSRFLALEKTLTSEKMTGRFLYVTQARQDYPVQYGMENLVKLLETKVPESVRWSYKKLEEEDHPTTSFPTIFHGLQEYYYNYPTFKISDFETFKAQGGFDYVDIYYKERAERFDFSESEMDNSVKKMRRGAVLSAISANDFEAFEFFMEQFRSEGFLEAQFLPHAYSYGIFYLENEKDKEAMDIFSFLAAKFEDSARPYNGMGDVYRIREDYVQAAKNYKKAIEIGKMNSDWRLVEYESNLMDLEQYK